MGIERNVPHQFLIDRIIGTFDDPGRKNAIHSDPIVTLYRVPPQVEPFHRSVRFLTLMSRIPIQYFVIWFSLLWYSMLSHFPSWTARKMSRDTVFICCLPVTMRIFAAITFYHAARCFSSSFPRQHSFGVPPSSLSPFTNTALKNLR